MQLEITYADGCWVIWRGNARIGGHVRQQDALRHAQELLAKQAELDTSRKEVSAATSGSGELKVLAAEDNRINCLVLSALLNQVGVEPVFVANGAEAVVAWERQDWDLILMDIQMPHLDGISATKAVRAAERASGRRSTAIVAVTANTMPGELATYRAAGMDSVIGKPIDAYELFGLVERVRLGASLHPQVHVGGAGPLQRRARG